MSRFSAIAAATAAVALTAGTPAFAKARAVRLPATTFRTAETKLCMAASSAGLKVEKGAPKTMCLTQADWEAQGVTFNLK